MNRPITASMLYDHTQCPYRVWADLYNDPTDRDPINPFVQLLWERGNAYEDEVIDGLKVPYTDLDGLPGDERERRTLQAMNRGDLLIYQGRIRSGNQLGDPDLLRRYGDDYIAADIKSGRGKAGDNGNGKPKEHYAVQLALYQDILQQKGLSGGRSPFVIDVNGDEVPYDLDEQMGPRTPTTLWQRYQDHLLAVTQIVEGSSEPLPALSAGCKLCHWHTTCRKHLDGLDDLSLIPELGRSKRDKMLPYVETVRDLAEIDLAQLMNGKKTIIKGIGVPTLQKFQLRAQLLTDPDAKPRVLQHFDLLRAETELYFDVETDPMRDICYLHGFWDLSKAGERYVPFIAEHPDPADEATAFMAAWTYIKASMPCHIYYYSPYERTTWRTLVEKHPEVMTVDEVEDLFSPERATDLYSIVRSSVEFPTNDKSVKTLAHFFGFDWRDVDPSGAGSIEWYHRYTESGDEAILKRILEYNEDDCIAMKVLLEGLLGL